MSPPDGRSSDVDEGFPVRLGEVTGGCGGGAVGFVEPGGSVELAGGGPRVQWWIGAEDRWHVPIEEPSMRRVPGATPVVVTAIRIPSGDAIGSVTCSRIDGLTGPSVSFHITNESPIPVALAYVVSSDAPMRVGFGGVVVDGHAELRLTRPALGFVTAASAAGLRSGLEANEIDSSPPADPVVGWLGVLVPLPHTAESVAVFRSAAEDGFAAGVRDDARMIDRHRVPSTARVAAGWSNHVATAPLVRWPGLSDRGHVSLAMCDLLMGVDDSAPLGLLAEVEECRGRLGWTKDPAGLITLAAAQHRSGRIGDVDPVGVTSGFLRAVGGWWRGGMSRELGEQFVGPLAAAGHWLARGRRRPTLEGREIEVADGLASAVGLLVDLGQPEVAADIVAFSERIAAVAGATETARGRPADAAGPGGDHGVEASCAVVRNYLDAVVAESADGLELAPGWTSMDAGVDLEAHCVPTRFGLVSYGVRWHGLRPAVLWELEPWPDRTDTRRGPDHSRLPGSADPFRRHRQWVADQ